MFLLAFATAFAAAFTQTLAVLIDKVIVCAFYGETEIAAVALAGPFFYLLEMPAAGLAAGVQTICAKELGAGQIERMNRKFNQIFYFSAIVLAALTVLSFIGDTTCIHPWIIRGRNVFTRDSGTSFSVLCPWEDTTSILISQDCS